jgi:hypothetical protein
MTGTNFSSWFNQGEGTLYAEAVGVDGAASRLLGGFSDGTFNNTTYVGFPESTDSISAAVRSSNFTQATIGPAAGTFVGGTSYKIALALKTNDISFAISKVIIGSDTSANLPIVDRFVIGSAPWVIGSIVLNGTIKKIAYYPKRLSNTNLVALTS